jgi:hypothetical protein
LSKVTNVDGLYLNSLSKRIARLFVWQPWWKFNPLVEEHAVLELEKVS